MVLRNDKQKSHRDNYVWNFFDERWQTSESGEFARREEAGGCASDRDVF